MKLVERHIIKQGHDFHAECDRVCFASKNLYNQALYRVRQHFFETGKYLSYYELQKQLQNEKQVDYKNVPAKVAQWTLKQLDQAFRSFFAALQTYKKQPGKFNAPPRLPKYKHKNKGRKVAIYTIQAISKKALREGFIVPSGTNNRLNSPVAKGKNIKQVQIEPRNNHYVISVIYEQAEPELKQNNRYAAIDVGLDNLAAIAFNFKQKPLVINGKPLKSINQFYNKQRAEAQAYVPNKSSKRLQRLNNKRNNKVKYYLHNASRMLVNQFISHDVSTVIIGKNNDWKQEINIGKKNNQNFVTIPHAVFIDQLKYKCRLEGIEVIVREESYTSKCSFFDNEPIRKQEKYVGKRIKRSWFRTASGSLVHADINAAYNIGKKQFPKAFVPEEIEGVVVHPTRLTPCK